MTAPTFNLGEVPFYWRMLDSFEADRMGIPDFLPFEFSFRPELQLVTEAENRSVLSWLERVYRENANVGYLQQGHSLALPYGDEFLRFLDSLLARRGAAPRSIMDIGCGGMYLLKILKDRGYPVYGVDPSPVARACADRFGIELFPEFYPSARVDTKVDLLLHHNVLEHVSDPVEFLRAHHGHLNRDGLVVVAVPDCGEAIARGDVSMMLHEHLVYFDADSLARTLAAAGFVEVEIAHSRYGGVLYGAGRSTAGVRSAAAQPGDLVKFEIFRDKARLATGRFREWVSKKLEAGGGPGFYVPLRAIPYLARCGATSGFRFFDDDPGQHRKFYAGMRVPVENFEDLRSRPAGDVMVCSYAFGQKISDKIRQQLRGAVRVALLQDIVSPPTV